MCRILVGGLLALWVTGACAAPADDLTATEHAFSAMAEKQGYAAAYLAYFAEDAADFGSGNLAPIYGRAAFAASLKTGPGNSAGSVLSWAPDHVKVSADGTMGSADGVWTYLGPPVTSGARMKLGGHYLRVWQKDASGAWKIAADMATNDPAGH
ncbi:MAG TPA: nuclear transport factor 2 family protein [Rhizomicrobium sp.]|jgi:ketosteroid isomerase-like protein|nr:nuclear transport factor 2 family protein [Rhizomicrobium sp.]